MHLHDVRHLGLAKPAFARRCLASLNAERNCFPPAFGIPVAARFKFFHLDTRHWQTLHNSKYFITGILRLRIAISFPPDEWSKPDVTRSQ
jgi:hypothetical protein